MVFSLLAPFPYQVRQNMFQHNEKRWIIPVASELKPLSSAMRLMRCMAPVAFMASWTLDVVETTAGSDAG